MSEFKLPVRVYLEDTDAGGILYYVNYLKYMERARTEWLRSMGADFQMLYTRNRLMVVHSLEVNYKRPALMDDVLSVTAQLNQMGAAYVIFQQQVTRQEEVLCLASVKVACVESAQMKPAPIPSDLRERFLASI